MLCCIGGKRTFPETFKIKMEEARIKAEIESEDDCLNSNISKELSELDTVSVDGNTPEQGKSKSSASELLDSSDKESAEYVSSSQINVDRYSLHICVFCGETFETLEILENHLVIHGDEGQFFKCDQCDKQYSDYMKLKRHRYTHRYETSIRCEICSKYFNCVSSFKRHLFLHTGLKPFSCLHCSESFTRRDKVNIHMLSVHGLNLADCLKYQKHKENILDSSEIAEKHPINSIMRCEEDASADRASDGWDTSERSDDLPGSNGDCGTPSPSKEASLNEIDLNPKSLGSYPCGICGRNFASQYILTRHLTTHNTDKPFKCNLCYRKYRDPNKLNQHNIKVHNSGEPIYCDVCFKTFNDKANLRRHKVVHSASRPFHCDLCSKKFTRKDHLKSHKLLHAWNGQDKERKCNTTDSTNTDPSNSLLYKSGQQNLSQNQITFYRKLYQKAIKTVIKEKKNTKCKQMYKCQQCNKIFAKSSNLKRHSEIHARGKLPKKSKTTAKLRKMRKGIRNMQRVSINKSEEVGKSSTALVIWSPDLDSEQLEETNTCGDIPNGQHLPHTNPKEDISSGSLGEYPDGLSSDVGSVFFPGNSTNSGSKDLSLSTNSSLCNNVADLIDPHNIKSELIEGCQDMRYSNEETSATIDSLNIPPPVLIDIEQAIAKCRETGINYCDICEKDFANLFILKRHLMIHTGEKPFECEQCFRRFRDLSKLKEHKKMHDSNTILHCDVCFKKFGDVTNLKRHKQLHSADKPFVCEFCYKSFHRKDHLKNHILQHLWNEDKKSEYLNDGDDTNVTIKCETGDNLDLNSRPIVRKYFECTICFKVYTKCSNLKRHKLIHLDDDTAQNDSNIEAASVRSGLTEAEGEGNEIVSKFIDTECENRSSCGLEGKKREEVGGSGESKPNSETDIEQNTLLEVSVASIDDEGDEEYLPSDVKKPKKRGRKKKERLFPKRTEFPCKLCSVVYETRLLLRRHECPNKEIFTCGVCNKKFLYLSSLRTHQVVHSKEKPFECPVCMKRFSLVHHLKGHLMLHSGEKPFQCEVCSKAFASSSDLKKHNFSHTGEKPFSCDVCQKMFKRPCDVTRHKLTHSGVRPHICGYCNKRFTQVQHLNSHLMIHFREFQPADSSEVVFRESE